MRIKGLQKLTFYELCSLTNLVFWDKGPKVRTNAGDGDRTRNLRRDKPAF